MGRAPRAAPAAVVSRRTVTIVIAASRPLPDHHGRRLGGHWPSTGEAAPDDAPSCDNPYENTPGHPGAWGTLPVARNLLDLAIEDEIQALAAQAPPMTEASAPDWPGSYAWTGPDAAPTNHLRGRLARSPLGLNHP